MSATDINKLNNQSLGFQTVSVLIGIVFGWAGLNLTWTLSKENEDLTFALLLVGAAPLFTVFLLCLLCFWFARMAAATNQLLADLLETSRQHQPVAPDSTNKPTTSQTALSQPPTSQAVPTQPTTSVLGRIAGAPEKICAVTDCGRHSHTGHALCSLHLGLDGPHPDA